MATLTFELVAPERVVFSGPVEAVVLPATEGDMTVLPGHVAVLTALKAGFVVLTSHVGEGSRVFVRGGFAEINGSSVTVLAERATPFEDLTTATLDQEILDAELRRDSSSDPEAKRVASMHIAHLEEAKEALKF